MNIWGDVTEQPGKTFGAWRCCILSQIYGHFNGENGDKLYMVFALFSELTQFDLICGFFYSNIVVMFDDFWRTTKIPS